MLPNTENLVPPGHYKSVLDKLHFSPYADSVSLRLHSLWFRYDTPDSDSRQQSDNYDIVREELASCGFELSDICIEHDCISGDLCYIVKSVGDRPSPADSLHSRILKEEWTIAHQAGQSYLDLDVVDARVRELTTGPVPDLKDYLDRTEPVKM